MKSVSEFHYDQNILDHADLLKIIMVEKPLGNY